MTEVKLLPNGDRLALRLLGQFLGMPEDELGHPYRIGEPYELDGQVLHRIHDWNPLDDDGDAFRLLMAMPLRVSHSWNLGQAHTFVGYNQSEGMPEPPAADYFPQVAISDEEHRAIVRRAMVYTALAWLNAKREQELRLESSERVE